MLERFSEQKLEKMATLFSSAWEHFEKLNLALYWMYVVKFELFGLVINPPFDFGRVLML